MKIVELISENERKIDISIYEKIIGLSFPEKFKKFCELYENGKNFNLKEFYHPLYERKYFFEKVFFKGLEELPITLFKFDSLDNIFLNWDSKKEEDDWRVYKFLRLCSIDIGGGIYIGFDGLYKDKVILMVWDSDDEFRILSNDIFDFIEKSEIKQNEDLLYGYKYSQLYKNDGEDFWRLREEKI
jgi:hypothetical protein